MKTICILRNTALLIACILPAGASPVTAQPAFERSADRGPGVSSSMFGTYIAGGEIFGYLFYEGYYDPDYEYKPSELGYGSSDLDYRGRYTASEGLIFLGYGITRDLIVELEAAVIEAEFKKAPDDPSAMPEELEEAGLGDVEAQLRWRFLDETENRPEFFTFAETVFPLQKDKYLIGTSDWEQKLGLGMVRGYRWGTMTVRVAAEYSRAEGKVDAGEYAVEYLKRISNALRVVAVLEGNQLDEVALITETQWTVASGMTLKANMGWGLTTNATDFSPEIGLMFRF